MRATIIVRHAHSRKIAQFFDLTSVDETTVDDAVDGLSKRYPGEGYVIDTSQVELARQALKVA